MSEEPKNENRENALQRAERVSTYVEKLIATVGEHPECELKGSWKRDNPYLKAEFIKDIQATANSIIPIDTEKYIVVGADETSRTIIGCSHDEFDDANIRQLLETYLDPIPDFEIFRLKSLNGIDFVIFRFPHQTKGPFIVTTNIFDEKKKCHLSEGQIWIKKDGSSGKQLLKTRSDLLRMIDIEDYVKREVEQRLAHLIPEIRIEERTRIGNTGFGPIPSFTSTDEEFELYVEQIIGAGDTVRFNILLEKIRDKTLRHWQQCVEARESIPLEKLRDYRDNFFLPTMQRLTLLGLLIIKFDGPLAWFERLADLLIDVHSLGNDLSVFVVLDLATPAPTSLEEVLNGFVPTLEALISAHVLIGYEIKSKSDVKYGSILSLRTVNFKSSNSYLRDEGKVFFLFYPFYLQTIDRRLDLLVAERYAIGGRIEEYFGSESTLKSAILQTLAAIDWVSFLSIKNLTGEESLAAYFRKHYPEISTYYPPIYTRESLNTIVPFVKKIWDDLNLGKRRYMILDEGLADVFSQLSLEQRKSLVIKFVKEAEKQHAKYMMAQMKFPFSANWPTEIASAIAET